jgi:hypothetical protein
MGRRGIGPGPCRLIPEGWYIDEQGNACEIVQLSAGLAIGLVVVSGVDDPLAGWPPLNRDC